MRKRYRQVRMSRHDSWVGIGRTGVEVTRLGLGTAPLGGMFTTVDDDDALKLVKAACANGIGYFDTAPLYGYGVAEFRLGRGLGAVGPGPRTICTKVGRLLVAGAETVPDIFIDTSEEQPVFDFSAAGIRRSLEESLARLDLDHVDILLIHDPDDHAEQALDEAYPELDRLRSEGIVKAIGVGIDHPELATRFVRETDIDLVLIAGRYTLLDQTAGEDLLPEALRRGIDIVTAGVFNSGILANPRPGATYEYEPAPTHLIERARAIGEVTTAFDVPLTAAALQFPLRHRAVTAVLTGARTARELLANIADFDRNIPEACWEALERSGLVSIRL